MYSKKILKLAQSLKANIPERLKDFKGLGSGKRGEWYYIMDPYRILATKEPIEGFDYDNTTFDYEKFFKDREYYYDYQKYIDIGKTVKELKEGRKKVEAKRIYDVLWRKSDQTPAINLKYLIDVKDSLKCDRLWFFNLRSPILFYYEDDFHTDVKMLVMPVINKRFTEGGFFNTVTNIYVADKMEG